MAEQRGGQRELIIVGLHPKPPFEVFREFVSPYRTSIAPQQTAQAYV
jgi:hypothetical protein